MGDIVFGDKYSGDRVEGNKCVNLDRSSRSEPRKVILLMSANPHQDQPLRLGEEHREIDLAVQRAHAGDRLKVRIADAVRLDDLQNALLRYRPAIAHFSGHGTKTAGIQVTDGLGEAHPVPSSALSDLFRILRNDLQCVVLNACFTEDQARAIAAHVPCVGMHGRILDDSAIRFAGGFYQGIAHAKTIRESFDLGRNRLDLHGHDDRRAPRLIAADSQADHAVIR